MKFSLDHTISLDQFRDLLIRSTLSERRPIADSECLQGMLDHADIIVSCWSDELLVGIARAVTDFHFCCYLCDLAVDQEFQGQGIGTKLISLTKERLHPKCTTILLSAPAATTYYPHIGFERHESAWILPNGRIEQP